MSNEMTLRGDVRMKFKADTLPEAVEHAAERWKTIVGDEDAELPWSTSFDITDAGGAAPVAGQLDVTVYIDLNRVTSLNGEAFNGRTTTV